MNTKTKNSGTRKKTVASKRLTHAWPPVSILNPGPNFKWSREVVFDFHEVCVKWTERFVAYVNRTYGYNMDANALDFYHMQMDPSNPLTPEQFEEAFVSFARRSEGGYGDLEAYDGIRKTMQRIKKAGIEVKIWTWTPGAAEQKFSGNSGYQTGIAQRVTLDLIKKLDLPVDVDRDVRFMTPGKKKFELAKEHIPLIVEDNPETAVGVASMAHAVILVPTSYNDSLAFRNVLPLSDRNDLADTVIGFFKELDAAGVVL